MSTATLPDIMIQFIVPNLTSWFILSHVYKFLRTFYVILTATSTMKSRMNWNSH